MAENDIKPSQSYYYLLARAGSPWGMDVSIAILEAENGIGEKEQLNKRIFEIESLRRQYIPEKEKRENLKIYDTSIPVLPNVISQWSFFPNLIQLLAVGLTSFVFYLPLSLLSTGGPKKMEKPPRVKQFIVTRDFIDEVAPGKSQADNIPPTTPSNLSVETVAVSVPKEAADKVAPIEPQVDNTPPAAPSISISVEAAADTVTEETADEVAPIKPQLENDKPMPPSNLQFIN